MQFYSVAFIAFLIVALVVYYSVGRLAGKGQWIVLLIASLTFYIYSGVENLIFIGTTALTTWGASLAFASIATRVKEERKTAKNSDEKRLQRRYEQSISEPLCMSSLVFVGRGR